MTIDRVKAAYAARVDEYIEVVGGIEHVNAAGLALVKNWALGCPGPILDVGCGPGQWTSWLSGVGVEVSGIDPVPEFIERAQARYPGVGIPVARCLKFTHQLPELSPRRFGAVLPRPKHVSAQLSHRGQRAVTADSLANCSIRRSLPAESNTLWTGAALAASASPI